MDLTWTQWDKCAAAYPNAEEVNEMMGPGFMNTRLHSLHNMEKHTTIWETKMRISALIVGSTITNNEEKTYHGQDEKFPNL